MRRKHAPAVRKSWATAPDGTLLATTYIKYRLGAAKQSVVCTLFALSETDALLREALPSQVPTSP